MSFKLSTGNTAYPSASAAVTSNGDTTANVTVYAGCYLGNGWVQSTGVVAKIYMNGLHVSTQTILGNGTKYTASTYKEVNATDWFSKNNGSSRSISWTVYFHQYTDGTDQGCKETLSGSISISSTTSYTISYNANGGSGAPSSQTKYYDANLTLSSTKPTRTGYSFQGWGTSASDTSVDYAAGATYSKNAGITLYAIWKANTYAVEYDANGGSGAPSQQTKTYGVNLTLSSTTPTRTNYNFLGWGTSASATTVSYAAGATYKNNSAITLYAVWELAYWKPKITNLSVARCASDGTADEYGTYALVKFDWELCQLLGTNNISSITIVCNSVTTTVSASGISGSVSQVIGAGALGTDGTYDVVVTVADSKDGSTSSTRTIATSAFTIDILAGGNGVAFGQAADTKNTLETPWKIRSTRTDTGFVHEHGTSGTAISFGVGSGGVNHGIYSNTRDRWLLYSDDSQTYLKDVQLTENIPVLGSGNCDSLTTTGKYYIGSSGTNRPVALNGWLECKKYSNYCHQVYTTYQGHTYTRLMSAGTWGSWNYVYGVNDSKSTNKVLATTVAYMHEGQTVALSEAVSKQRHGIVLIWSAYYSGEPENYNFSHHFVPKQFVAAHPSAGMWCSVLGAEHNMSKYVFVNDTSIMGYIDNIRSDLISDVYIHNYDYVLRYVLGV